ncbi:MAG TPA: sulfotransferase family 2 domain-containing protein [Planktothrix sp.]|jgi:hypothetical protein
MSTVEVDRLGRFPFNLGKSRPKPRLNDTVVFTHIPKTAGMSLGELIRNNIAPERLLELYTADSRDRLSSLSPEQVRALDAIMGHIPFSFLSSIDLVKPALALTVLRDPVERIISFYTHARRNPDHYLHEAVTEGGVTLQEMVRQGMTLECDNLQVRYLCSADLSGVPVGSCSDAMLDDAINMLSERFAVVGIVEHFVETVELVCDVCHWKRTKMHWVNVSPQREIADAAALEAIRDANQLDIKLYLYALQLFQKRMG